MNIHIIPNGTFAYDFIAFINRYFSGNQFYVMENGQDYEHIESNNVVYIKELADNIDMSLITDSTDKLYVHGFFDYATVDYLYSNTSQIDFSRVVLVIWGAEIYNNRFLLKSEPWHIGVRLHEYKKKRIVEKTRMFMTFASPDFDNICKWYHTRGFQFDCLYPSSIDKDYLDGIMSRPREGNCITILVGNSATITNQHIEVFNVLSKFRNERIQIVSPLSYGDMNYADKVIRTGRSIFGDKFMPITDFLKPQEYTDLLNGVDIAVFNNNRQQATANIEILSYLGKKVYIRSDTSTWGHYVTRDGCTFYDTLRIKNQCFEQFIEHSDSSIRTNRLYFSQIWDQKHLVDIWNKVFCFMLPENCE